MKKLLLALVLLLAPSAAFAQCTGIFGAGTVCGTVAGGPPGPIAFSSVPSLPGGSSGQIQYNSSSTFAGFTAIGDCTITPSTGQVTCTKTNGVAFGTFATAAAAAATAGLNLFTTSLQGLAPASGGGTTNYLRADGTWAAPPTPSATGVSFTSLGTGAVATTVGAKLNSMVWIGDFNAKCDGVTNDTTAIQNAWNYAATIGANVWLGGLGPTCLVSTGLTMPTPVVATSVGNFGQSHAAMLVGPGATEVTLLSAVTGTSCAVTISATYGTNSYLAGVFQGVGLKQSTNAKAGYGWCLRGITKAQFRDVSTSQFLRGMDATDSILINIFESNFSQNTNHIVAQKSSTSEPNGWNIIANHFETSANYGIYLLAGQQNNIRLNDFESNGSSGSTARSIYVSQLNQGTNTLANIDGNYFEGNQGYELEIDQSSFNQKAVVNFTGNTLGKNNAGQVGGILITNSGTVAAHTTVNIAGNSFLDALASGQVWFQTSAGTANFLWNCSQLPNEFSPTTNVNATCLVATTGYR